MKIIGITGTLGAGKGTVVEYLVKDKGYSHFSVRDYLISEIEKRKLPVNRDSMTFVANELRAANSPSFIIEELYKQASAGNCDAIIESIRTPGEVDFLKQQGDFVLLAVDAEAELRFKRIKLRASETDKIDFETFVANEKREMSNKDPNKQNLSKCIEMADILINNNGALKDLINQLDKLI